MPQQHCPCLSQVISLADLWSVEHRLKLAAHRRRGAVCFFTVDTSGDRFRSGHQALRDARFYLIILFNALFFSVGNLAPRTLARLHSAMWPEGVFSWESCYLQVVLILLLITLYHQALRVLSRNRALSREWAVYLALFLSSAAVLVVLPPAVLPWPILPNTTCSLLQSLLLYGLIIAWEARHGPRRDEDVA